MPAGTVTDEGGVSQFGVTVVARTFEDGVAADIAGRIERTPEKPELFAAGAARAAGAAGAARTPPAAPKVPWPVSAGAGVVPLVVVGAHRKGQPLAAELERRGAFWDGRVVTAARYRMVALETTPPKPGVVRSEHGAGLVAERWLLSEAALGLSSPDPEPMLLGSITLDDGSTAVGFACDAVAADGARDITEYGDWIKYLEESPAVPGNQGLWREAGSALLTGLSRGQR